MIVFPGVAHWYLPKRVAISRAMVFGCDIHLAILICCDQDVWSSCDKKLIRVHTGLYALACSLCFCRFCTSQAKYFLMISTCLGSGSQSVVRVVQVCSTERLEDREKDGKLTSTNSSNKNLKKMKTQSKAAIKPTKLGSTKPKTAEDGLY